MWSLGTIVPEPVDAGSLRSRSPLLCVRAADRGCLFRGQIIMTILDNVEKLVLRLAPSPVCDDCLTDKLGLTILQHADQASRELAGSNGFERSKDECGLCGETRLVIRHR